MKVALYSRVSTDRQEVENQLVQLREYCDRNDYEIYKEYVDEGISGTQFERPSLNEMLEDVFLKRFDMLIVWKLDRLGRSLSDLIKILEKLNSRNIKFISLTQNIDTTTPMGKLMFQLLGSFAEFESNILSERIKAGMKRAKDNGKQLGRKPNVPITEELVEKIIDLRESGKTYRDIKDEVGLSLGKVYEICNPQAVQND